MLHLLDNWGAVSPRIRKASHIFLFSDYDGTLTPIVERPEDAVLADETRKLLGGLAKQRRYTVGIISGRSLMDLMARVGLSDIVTYAGNHGMEIHGKGLDFVEPVAEEMQSLFRVLHHVLSITLRGVTGVLVENKGLTLSVHYRRVREKEVPQVKSIVDRVAGPLNSAGRIRITSGKKVLELRPPVSWNKGKAVELLLRKHGDGLTGRNTLAVFLGDDLTDEDGFKMINARDGLSVYVGDGNQPSSANYYLASPQEVCLFLKRLVEMR